MRNTAMHQYFSGVFQKPAGDSAVAERTAPRAASSRAMSPPSELPATWGRSNPSSPTSFSTMSAIVR